LKYQFRINWALYLFFLSKSADLLKSKKGRGGQQPQANSLCPLSLWIWIQNL